MERDGFMKRIRCTLKGCCEYLFMELDDDGFLESYLCNCDDAPDEGCYAWRGACPMKFDELYGTKVSVK